MKIGDKRWYFDDKCLCCPAGNPAWTSHKALYIFLMLFYHTFREAVEFIHFCGLKKATRRSELRSYFSEYGEIADMYVGNDNGHHTGNFYLQFWYKVSAERVRQMPVHEVDGSILRVYAPRQPFER